MGIVDRDLKPYYMLVCLLVLFISLLFFIFPIYSEETDLEEISVDNERILIVSPHPDDESLAVAGIIKKAVDNNQSVLLVEVTDGSGSINSSKLRKFNEEHNSSGSLVEIRRNETINAMKTLGLSEENIIFLGYPDGGLNHMFNDNWGVEIPFKSNNEFNQFDYCPYNYTYKQNSSYSGACLSHDLNKIIHEFKPTSIYYPDVGDEHKDHRATSAFVMYSSAENNYTGNKYTYLIHKSRNWPSPSIYAPILGLLPPDEVYNLDAIWYKSNLNLAEQWAKEQAINSYQTQIYNTNGKIRSFIRRNEIFAVYPKITLSKVESNFTGHIMPESTFQDVRVKFNSQELQNQNLTSAGLAYNEKQAILILKCPELTDEKSVNFHLRIYDQKFKRIDIRVQNKSAQYEKKDSNSFNPKIKPEDEYLNQTLIVKIPLETILSSKIILFSVDIKDVNNNLIYQMPWREMALPNKK
jgi:LmbE family N-acetylglucosaminyl deacetylase